MTVSYTSSAELYAAREFLEQSKKDEWACFTRQANSLKKRPIEGKLKAEVHKVYEKIKINAEQTKGIETVWDNGESKTIEIAHTIYQASFPPLNVEKWNPLAIKQWHPLIWAASHRCQAKPGDIEWVKDEDGKYKVSNTKVFEEQMEIDTLGLMGELFLCKLFEWDFNDFWHNFCIYAGKGDDDWDILIKTASLTQYYVDAKVKVKKDSNSWNIGGGKLKGKLLAPITQREEKGKYHFKFSHLIDVETFWDTVNESGYSSFLRVDNQRPNTRYFFENALTYDENPRYMSEYQAEVLDRWQLLAFKCMDENSFKKSKKVLVIDS